MHISSVWHSSGGDTRHLPGELWHRTHTHAAASSPHLWLYLSQITAWHWGQKWALGGGRVKRWWQSRRRRGGWGYWVKGREGAKSHLELYAFPSLSPIQINWIYAAIVWLKPHAPAASPLPHRKSVTLKAKSSTSCLSAQALQTRQHWHLY